MHYSNAVQYAYVPYLRPGRTELIQKVFLAIVEEVTRSMHFDELLKHLNCICTKYRIPRKQSLGADGITVEEKQCPGCL